MNISTKTLDLGPSKLNGVRCGAFNLCQEIKLLIKSFSLSKSLPGGPSVHMKTVWKCKTSRFKIRHCDKPTISNCSY